MSKFTLACGLFFGAALIGSAGGVAACLQGAGGMGFAGALLLFAVIPFTLVFIMPINNQLLAPGRSDEAPDTEMLLRRWAPLHAVRTVLSAVAFVLFAMALGQW